MKLSSLFLCAISLTLGLAIFISPVASQENDQGKILQAENAEEPKRSFLRGKNSLALQTEAHDSLWGLSEASWAVDLDAGLIEFTNEKGWTITAPVQVIGTYNTIDGTWLWGWDHPYLPEPVTKNAQLTNIFGKKHELELLTTQKVEISKEQAWDLTALAAYLGEAQGAYRGPSGTVLVYMTFGEVKIVKE